MNRKITLLVAGTLAASLLAASEDNLLKGIWASYGPEGKPTLENKVLKAPAVNTNTKKSYYASALTQTLKNLPPGKYELSGKFKGPMKAMWIVLRCRNKDKKETQVIQQWIGKSKFNPIPESGGWNKFFCVGTIPADTVQCSVYIQGFGQKGEIHEFKEIELVESED